MLCLLDIALAVAQVLERQTDRDAQGRFNDAAHDFAIAKRMMLQEEVSTLRDKAQKELMFHRGKMYTDAPVRAFLARIYLALVVIAAIIALVVFAANGALSYAIFKEILFWLTFALVTVFGIFKHNDK